MLQTLITASAIAGLALSEIVAVHKFTSEAGEEVVGTLEANQPKLCDSVKQYSGYFSAGGDKKYFYWFFESRNAPSTDPLTMWLTGGPGCSSMMALLSENGPCSVNQWATDTVKNPYSWNTRSNLLYVDQPPGTGFSTGTYDHSEAGVATDMYAFLQAFITAFPSYFNNGYYLFGESYAGHYVPAISYAVYNGNKNNQGTYIPLKGIAIGNGLTDPEVQYAYYAKMAYNSTTAPSVIDEATYNQMKAAIPQCQSDIRRCQSGGGLACDSAYMFCNERELSPVQNTGINLYDLRVKCKVPPLCYNFTQVTVWLNNATVQQQLGVNGIKWESCNYNVNSGFEADWMKDYQTNIPPQLENGTHVLIYAGDQDFVCNWLGNQAWTLALPWSGQTQFNLVKPTQWKPDSQWRGNLRTYKNFHFLQFFKAGHMVPMDQPEGALLMLDAFLSGNIGKNAQQPAAETF